MERYIEAEALKKVMCEGCDNIHLCTESPACETVQQIDAQPTADVAPVKHGRWIWYSEICAYSCSECHKYQYGNTLDVLNGTYRYCPNCGARMDLDEVEE
jgi:hypothetical protein